MLDNPVCSVVSLHVRMVAGYSTAGQVTSVGQIDPVTGLIRSDPAMAVARIASMTPEKVRSMNQIIDELPAGGSSPPGTAVLVILVLLFTAITGFTDVFPFVKKTAG
jgi:Family of unknown function (DUF6627)